MIFSLRRGAFGFSPNCKNKPKDIWRFMKIILICYFTPGLMVSDAKKKYMSTYWAERRKNFEEFVSSKYCRGRVTSEKLSSVPNLHTGPNKCRAF